MRWLARKFAALTLVAIAAGGCTGMQGGTPVANVTHDILNGEWRGTATYSWISYTVNQVRGFSMRVDNGRVAWESLHRGRRSRGTSTMSISDGIPYFNFKGRQRVLVKETPEEYSMHWDWASQGGVEVPAMATFALYRPKTPMDTALQQAREVPPEPNAIPVGNATLDMLEGEWSGSINNRTGNVVGSVEMDVSWTSVNYDAVVGGEPHQRVSSIYVTKDGSVRYQEDGLWRYVEVFDGGDKYIMRWYAEGATKATVVSRPKMPEEMAKP